MKFKLALLVVAVAALSGCKKNDIDCGSADIQQNLAQRILNVIAEKTGALGNDPDALSHAKVVLDGFTQDEDQSTKEISQCKVNATLTDERNSGVALKGQVSYALSKDSAGHIVVDNRSVYAGTRQEAFKVVKIDETPEQKAWREKQEQAAAEQAKAEAEAKARQAAQDAALEKEITAAQSAPDSDFKPVNQQQLMLLFLENSGRQVSDDEKLGLLSAAWNSEKDPFKKNDMKAAELARINQELDAWKGVKLIQISKMNYRMNGKKDAASKQIITDAYLGIRKPGDYDFTKKSFPITMTGCNDSLKYGPQTLYSSRQNVKINLVKNIATCALTPKDEEDARRLSGLFTAMAPAVFTTDATAYLLISGYDADNVSVNTTLIRTDIQFYHNNYDAVTDKAPVLTWTLK
ncbi:hypothetical protein [Tatumella citrea]|uniref:Uncharacterized protein n=1 Tax=Tatumella citrea TaxID=53336 RepID=A0A1Y0LGA3_TATCI|nr:hypothetical protein [Tatumella citrea]ARU92643.1 hypothetical protein A7K98_01845 [Tatumella citrea]ARU96679.1 hypothetical protein A7K99_01845 [Tatumella citrea]